MACYSFFFFVSFIVLLKLFLYIPLTETALDNILP